MVAELKTKEVEAIKILIKKAFAALRKNKIVARMNFSCCRCCGGEELKDIVKEKKLDGYVFYHNQGEDDLQESGNVYLNYDAGDQPITAVGIGRLIVSVCKEVGLPTEWDGTSGKCILIKGSEYLVQWRKDDEHRKLVESLKRDIKQAEQRLEHLRISHIDAVYDLTEKNKQLMELEK